MSLVPPFLLVDRYDVSEEIGRGGHAVVFRAHDRVLDREVAVKILREDALSSDTLARFRQEVQVTAQLEHAHILHVYDTGAYEGRPYIVMELASGRTLADRLQREGQLPVTDALQIARDVGLALAHAHARGVVHRDVKPDNILLGPGGAILADFGIARVTQEALTRKITSTGTAVGTVQYMSPEQLCAEPNIDARSDQYALACVLYEMLAGVRPHIAATFEGLRMLRMTGQHVPVSAHRPSVPDFVDETIAVALSPMPADRYRSLEAMLAAMGVAASGEFSIADGSGARRGSGGYGGVPGSGGGRAGSSGAGSRRGTPRGGLPSALSADDATATDGRKRWVLPAVVGAVVVLAGAVYALRGGAGASDAPLAPGDVAVVVTTDGERGSVADTTSPVGRLQAALREELGLWPAVHLVERVARGDSTLVVLTPAINAVADSVRVRLTVRQGGAAIPPLSMMVSATELVAPGALAKTLVLRALVRQIDPQLTHVETPGVEALPGRSMAGLRAYVRGFAALRGGELDSASARFREAAQQAPGFAQAEYWAAQSGAWAAPRSVQQWARDAEAASLSKSLSGTDSILVRGLLYASQGNFPKACDEYTQAIANAPDSYVAWFNLGECQRLDSAVVQTARGPRFRSSHWSALAAYRETILKAPTSEWLASVYPGILRTTYAEGVRARHGRSATTPHDPFSALPSLDSDTIALIPLERAEFISSRSVPTTWIAAIRRGRDAALTLSELWVKRWSDSPSAWMQFALALELSGRLSDASGGISAMTAIARAERNKLSPATRARIAVAKTRIALRLGDTRRAYRIGTETLRSLRAVDASTAAVLLPLAAFVGDVFSAERLAVASRDRNSGVPEQLADSLASFTVRAEMGACEKLADSRARIESMIGGQLSPSEAAAERQRMLLPAYRTAVPCLGVSAIRGFAPQLQLDRVYQDLDRGDAWSARRTLAELRLGRRGATVASITWDYIFAESWALAYAGDASVARAQLTAALDNIATMSLFTLEQAAQAAGLRRGMSLCDSLSRAGVQPITSN